MRQFWLYLYMEWKKMRRGLPGILASTLILAVFLAGFLFVFQDKNKGNGKINTIRVGLVAAEEEPYLDWMIKTLKNVESTKYVCEFERMTEEEGNSALQSKDIDALFIIPENYIASLVRGSNKPVVIRFGKKQVDIAAFFIRQVAIAASEYILDTEAGIYAMKDYYRDQNLPNIHEDELELNLLYLEKVLGRQNLIETEQIETMEQMGSADYYFVAGIVLFLLFWGLACSSILKKEPLTLRQKLYQAGIHTGQQTLARSLAFCAVYVCNFVLVAALVLPGACVYGNFGEISLAGVGEWSIFLIGMLPVVLLAAVCIMFAFEILGDSVGGTVFLFLSILVLGFISGCFYPFRYLPESLQAVAEWLPLRVMFRYTSASIRQESIVPHIWEVLSYIVCMYLLTTGFVSVGRRREE